MGTSAARMTTVTVAEPLPRLIDPASDVSRGLATDEETSWLGKLASEGLKVAPLVVVPASAESEFYRSNNLPSQLAQLFAEVEGHDPDEDELEELAPQARQLVKGHFLLEEFIDTFYQTTGRLDSPVTVRRPGQRGQDSPGGRSALMALKDVWAQPWSVEALLQRLRVTGSVALEAQPVLVSPATSRRPAADLDARVSAILNHPIHSFIDMRHRITRLEEVAADTSRLASEGKV